MSSTDAASWTCVTKSSKKATMQKMRQPPYLGRLRCWGPQFWQPSGGCVSKSSLSSEAPLFSIFLGFCSTPKLLFFFHYSLLGKNKVHLTIVDKKKGLSSVRSTLHPGKTTWSLRVKFVDPIPIGYTNLPLLLGGLAFYFCLSGLLATLRDISLVPRI